MGLLRRTYQFLFKTLYGKTITTFLILSSILLVYIFLEYRAVNHLAGESTRINLAGQLRYRAFETGWLLNRLAGKDVEKLSEKERAEIVSEIRHEVVMFDTTLSYLKKGEPSLGIKPVLYSDAIKFLEDTEKRWRDDLRPFVLKVLSMPESTSEKEVRAALKEYNDVLHAFVYGIDRFVGFISTDHEKEVRRAARGHLYMLLIAFFSGLIILYTTRKNLIFPVLRLYRATKSISDGNFGARVDIRTGDELETLGESFNRMAEKIRESLEEKVKLIKNLQGIHNATKAVLADIDYKTVLKEVIDEGRRLLDTRYAALGILSNESGYETFFQSGMDEDTYSKLLRRYGFPSGKGLLGYIIHEDRPVRVDNIRGHPASKGFPEGHPEMNTLLGVPINLQGSVIGRLYFTEKRGGGIFTEEDERLALSYASTVAMVIKNARQIRDLRERKEEIEALGTASVSMINLDQREGVYQRICEIALEVFKLKMVWMGLVEEGTYEIKPRTFCGQEEGYLDNIKIRWDDSEYARGPTGRAVKNRRPVAVNDIETDPDYRPWCEAALRRDTVPH